MNKIIFLFLKGLFLLSVIQLYPGWVYQNNKEIMYLFAPGIWACESQAALYCKEMTTSTQEKIINTNDFEVMQKNKVVACNFAEAKPTSLLKNKKFSLYPWPVLSLLVNFFAPYFIKRSYKNRHLTIHPSTEQTHTINPFVLKLKNINLGQEKDTELFSACYDRLIQEKPDADIVLYGFSRGAAAVFNFIATHYNEKSNNHIKAIVLEGCFDSVAELTPTLFSKFLSYLLPYYKHRGIEPIKKEILQQFVSTCNHHNIPILFITSNKDRVVPAKNVLNLYNALIEEGLQNCQCIILNNAHHSNYINHEQEKYTYAKKVHEFYKEYNLAYLAEYIE